MRKELLLSIVLAIGIMAASLWIVDRSLLTNTSVDTRRLEVKQPDDAKAQYTEPVKASASEVNNVMAKEFTSDREVSAASGISKCIVNGKTVYSDQACPHGAKRQAITLHDSNGILSPAKESLADLTAKRKASEVAYKNQAQSRVVSLTQENGAECGWLENRIVYLDAMARQPQSLPMQDWIRSERQIARDRQFAAHC